MNGRLILVVDDEPPVGQLIVRTLERHRYFVKWARTAEEASNVWQQEPGSFRLALIDISLDTGENAGFKLASQLEVASPGTFFIFMSGFTAEHYPEENLVQGINFLEKPFYFQQLLDIVGLYFPQQDS